MAFDDVMDVLFPERVDVRNAKKDQAIQDWEHERRKILATRQDEEYQIGKAHDAAMKWGGVASTSLKTGDVDGAAKALNKAMAALPGYGGFDIVDANGQKMINIKESDGTISSVPYNLSSLKQLNDKFLSYAEPKSFINDYMQAKRDHEKRNADAKGTPIELADGKKAYVQFDDDGKAMYFDYSTNKPIAGLPDTLAGKRDKETYALGIKKENAGIRKTDSETAENYANIGKIKAETDYVKNYKGQGKTGTEKDDDKYDKSFTDAMQKKYGLMLNSRDNKGNLIPQVFPKETVEAMDAWAQKNGYELLVRDNGDNYEVFDYKRLESVQPAPKPSASPTQPKKQAPKQSQYKSLNDRKARNFASQYLNSGDAGRKFVKETVLKNYGSDAWKAVQTEISRLSEAMKDAKKKKVFLKWGGKEYYIPEQGKV
jgi:hypothetical protein